MKLTLNTVERRISIILAMLLTCRMLGSFLLLPVFTIAVRDVPGVNSSVQAGVALGIYGLTQAVMQIPFGLASDRWGRKPIIVAGLLLFITGSILCALGINIYWIVIGRAIQGSGAISAVVTAWLSDCIRDEVHSTAMAIVGGFIGLAFALSMLLSPMLAGWLGLSGVFWTITWLGFAGLALALWVTPAVQLRLEPNRTEARYIYRVLVHYGLLKINSGVFFLHLIEAMLFIVLPESLTEISSLNESTIWKFYFPTITISLVLMLPIVLLTEKKSCHYNILKVMVVTLMITCSLLYWASKNICSTVILITIFFVALNVLETLQPTLVSRAIPTKFKGLALGFYNAFQSVGFFIGSVLGGWLTSFYENRVIFFTMFLMTTLWLSSSWALRALKNALYKSLD